MFFVIDIHLFFCSCADQEFCYMAVRENTEQYTVVMILLGAVSLDSSEAIIMTTLREIESNYVSAFHWGSWLLSRFRWNSNI